MNGSHKGSNLKHAALMKRHRTVPHIIEREFLRVQMNDLQIMGHYDGKWLVCSDNIGLATPARGKHYIL